MYQRGPFKPPCLEVFYATAAVIDIIICDAEGNNNQTSALITSTDKAVNSVPSVTSVSAAMLAAHYQQVPLNISMESKKLYLYVRKRSCHGMAYTNYESKGIVIM